MSLRIIGGAFQGRRLIAPPGLETRPMPDRIKQSLFDWLGQDLSGQSFADVCAGSGTVGLEALSRGAGPVHLIESGRHAQPAIRANLAALGNPSEVTLHPRPFASVLPGLRSIDLIFCDPPFPWFQEQPETLAEFLLLAKNAVSPVGSLLIRGERGQDLPLLPHGLRIADKRLYGRSWIARIAAFSVS